MTEPELTTVVAAPPREPTQPIVIAQPAAPEPSGPSRLLRWAPLVGVLAIVAGAVTGYGQLHAHACDTVIHPPSKAVVEGRGFAFQEDVRRALESARGEMKGLRRDLHRAVFKCHRIPGDGMDCVLTVPEGD